MGDPVSERIENALRPWRSDRTKQMFERHVSHWMSTPLVRADAARNIGVLADHIAEMFADETPVPPDVCLAAEGARRLGLFINFAPGKPDAYSGTWQSMQPACKYKSQIGQLANMIQTQWEAIEQERETLSCSWLSTGACDWGAAFCVPCLPNAAWDNERTRESVPGLILRYAAFYLLMTLRILRPSFVVVCNYEAAKMLTFVHEYAHLRTAEAWLGTASLDRSKMVCPQTFDTVFVRFGEMGFHVFRFHVPFYLEKLVLKDASVLDQFKDGVRRMVNTLNPMPRDPTQALQQPRARGAKKEKAPRVISVRGQKPVSFAKSGSETPME